MGVSDDVKGSSRSSLRNQELMTLIDLQRFLAEELKDSLGPEEDFSRSFVPINDGLGLEAPPKKPAPPQKPLWPSNVAPSVKSAEVPAQIAPAPKPFESMVKKEDLQIAKAIGAEPLSKVDATPAMKPRIPRIVDPSLMEDSEAQAESLLPPPRLSGKLNRALGVDLPESKPVRKSAESEGKPCSVFRRMAGGLMDQVLMLAIASAIIAITVQLSPEGALGFQGQVRPDMVRNWLAGYLVLWLGYLVIAYALLESSFGMWIWGMRLQFDDSYRGWRKSARVLIGLFFLAPVFPALLLMIQRRGRNMLDWLSGSEVVRTA